MDFERSQRLQKLPPYLFAALRQKMAAAKEKGIKVIRIDIGDPDTPTPDLIVQEMQNRVADPADPDRHRYGCDRPAGEFPEAIKSFYQRRWGVTLKEEQVSITTGSKDAIVQFALGVMNPGDLGIAPVPGYPTYNIGHVFAGGVTYQVPLRPEDGFLLDFDAIPAEVARLAKILWISYPNNPKTAIAPM